MKMFNRNRYTKVALLTLAAALLFSGQASAAGLEGVNSFLQTVVDMLTGAGLVVVTIAISWVGYKMIFKGAAFSEVATVFIGGMFIGLSSTIAGLIIN